MMPDLTLTDLTDEELGQLAQVTDQDIIDTHRFMMMALDDEFKNLSVTKVDIDAESTDQS